MWRTEIVLICPYVSFHLLERASAQSALQSITQFPKASNMISHFLPVVALAGAAMAFCPLAVEISGATDHIAHVAVRNVGNQTVTVFKGNTVLSAHATKDLLVADAGLLIPSL